MSRRRSSHHVEHALVKLAVIGVTAIAPVVCRGVVREARRHRRDCERWRLEAAEARKVREAKVARHRAHLVAFVSKLRVRVVSLVPMTLISSGLTNARKADRGPSLSPSQRQRGDRS